MDLSSATVYLASSTGFCIWCACMYVYYIMIFYVTNNSLRFPVPPTLHLSKQEKAGRPAVPRLWQQSCLSRLARTDGAGEAWL